MLSSFSLKFCKKERNKIKAARKLCNLGEKGEEQNQRGREVEQKILNRRKESKEYSLKRKERLA